MDGNEAKLLDRYEARLRRTAWRQRGAPAKNLRSFPADRRGIELLASYAWQDHRNKHHAKANWQFKTADARIKLKRLYPQLG
jgi:hypothetical protein